MEIEQFRVVLRAKEFEQTCRFYGVSLALPVIRTWESAGGRGAQYLAGGGVIEVIGRAGNPSQRDETFDYRGPQQKMGFTLLVPSAERAYEEILFRDKNIPGGLRRDGDGALVFATRDPDGVHVYFREEGSS